MKKIYLQNDQIVALEVGEVSFDYATVLMGSDADWMISYRLLKRFLALPDDLPIGFGYIAAEVREMIVTDDDGSVIALLDRKYSKEFRCDLETEVRFAPQEFWEALYPNRAERAAEKVYQALFAERDVWYFTGKKTGVLYAVYDGEVITCRTGKIKKCAKMDGLSLEYYRDDENDLDIAALEGTDYEERGLRTTRAMLAAVKRRARLWMALLSFGLTEEELKAVA